MDLNHIRALAGLPSKPLAIAAPVIVEEKLPEAKVIRDEPLNEGKRSVVDRICGELEAGLKKVGVKMNSQISATLRSSISDAYDDGLDDGSAQDDR